MYVLFLFQNLRLIIFLITVVLLRVYVPLYYFTIFTAFSLATFATFSFLFLNVLILSLFFFLAAASSNSFNRADSLTAASSPPATLSHSLFSLVYHVTQLAIFQRLHIFLCNSQMLLQVPSTSTRILHLNNFYLILKLNSIYLLLIIIPFLGYVLILLNFSVPLL